MAPPQLATHAPRLDVAHPLVIRVLPLLGHEHRMALFDRFDGRLGERRRVDVPLVGQPGLQRHARAVAVRDHVRVRLDLLEQTQALHLRHDRLARAVALHAPEALGHVARDVRVLVEDVDHGELMAAADFEVVEVVRGRDLDGTRPLLGIGILVRDDRNAASDDRQDRVLADQILESRIVRMHRDARVAQHGFGPRRRHDDVAVAFAFDRVLEVPELALDLPLLDFQVGNRRVQLGVPIDQALVAINQPLSVQFDEHLAHGARKPLVHREAFARPIGRGAQTAQLARDRPAAFAFPRPGFLEELVAPDQNRIRFRRDAAAVEKRAALGQTPLDDHLGGDARMVRARLPQRIAAAHALEADQRVLDRERQRVTHMQRARNVGRRHHDRVGRFAGRRVGRERARGLPRGVAARFDVGGRKGFGEAAGGGPFGRCVGHGAPCLDGQRRTLNSPEIRG